MGYLFLIVIFILFGYLAGLSKSKEFTIGGLILAAISFLIASYLHGFAHVFNPLSSFFTLDDFIFGILIAFFVFCSFLGGKILRKLIKNNL